MKKRKLKLFSFLLSLILVVVSVPMSVVAEEVDTSEVSEIITEIQEGLDDVAIADDFLEIQDDFADINSVASTSTSEQITYLPDGIYAFESVRNPGYYMRVNGDGTAEDQNIQQSPFSTSPSIQYNKYALFKVTRISGTNRYSIRLIADSNSSLTFGANGTDVVTDEIPENDSELSESQTFEILHNSYGFMFRSCANQKFIAINGTTESTLQFKNAVNNSICWTPRGYRIHIEDGVYAFENIAYDGFWMDVNNNSYQSGASAIKSHYDDSPAGTFSRRALFKVTQIGTTGRYVVRLMTNNLLTWKTTNSSISSYEITSIDSNVAASLTYNIIYDGNGFVLVPYRATAVISAGDGSNLILASKNAIPDSARWTIHKYTGSIAWGVGIIAPSDMSTTGAIVGDSYTVKPVVWTTSPGFQNVRISLASSNNHNAMYLKWDSDKQEALAVIANPGCISLSVDLVLESSGYISILCSEQYEWNAIPREGTYYLQNRKTNNYASIVELYSDEGDLIWPAGSTSSNNSKWQIEHVYNSGGYVTIKSLYNGKYIGIDPNDITQIYQCSTVGNNTLWRFEILDDSSVKIICKASESSGKVAVISLSGINEGLGLLQREYTDDSDYSDEWYVIKYNSFSIVNYYDLSFASNNMLIDYISEANEFASKVFLQEFGIEIIMDGSATYYHTIADDCPQGINGDCDECGTNCYSHHKNRLAISNQIYNSARERNHIYVLWGNRGRGTFCDNVNNQHSQSSALAVVMGYRPVIHMMRLAEDRYDDLYTCMAINLVHEIVHTFGMPDVYDNTGHDLEDGTRCIMERFDGNTAEQFYAAVDAGNMAPFCSSCTAAIREHISQIEYLYY